MTQPLSRPFGRIRQSAVLVLAAALMAGGVFTAFQSMRVDDEMRTHYEDAIALSQIALETQQASALFREHQTRAARRLADMMLLGPAPTVSDLETAANTLRVKLESIDRFRLSPGEEARMTELKRALSSITDINKKMVAASRLDETGLEEARTLAAQSEQRFKAFEGALFELTNAVRSRIADAARRADDLNLVARYALILFSAVTLALAVLSTLLTLRTLRENRALLDRMQSLAREDPLTGAINRRGMDEVLPIEFSRAHRSGEPLTLVMIDLDHFKRYNDRRGHPAGDAVLRGSAQAWLKQLRPTDKLARYGGEEFTLVLPGTDVSQAAQLVQRLRPLVPDRQTFSAGIAKWDGTETAVEVLQRADAALLQAKKAGRNRTMIAGEEPQVTLPLMVA